MFQLEVECHECPVSYITPQSLELLNWYGRARRAHEAFGTAPYGSNLSRWPAIAVDIVTLIEQERLRVENQEARLLYGNSNGASDEDAGMVQ
jgi:hypothetical protein